jgi:pilus assembly protein Flp/PilA
VKEMLFAPKEKGQGLVEYALILVLVAIVVIAVLLLLGPIIGNVFSTVNNSLSAASGG